MSEPSLDEDQRILQEMIGRFQAPSFIRRAKLVENAWQQLRDRCQQERLTRLEFVRLRLGQLHTLADGLDRLGLSVEDHTALQRLFDELQPRLRLPLERTTALRVWRNAAADLVDAMTRFNARWAAWLAKLDLTAINQARDAYNRYYLVEKECAFRSASVARRDFQRLAPITLEEIGRLFPMLAIPVFDL